MVGGGNGLFYPIVGFASCFAFIYLSFGDFWIDFHKENGSQFILDGRASYINGRNSHWLMDHVVDEYSRPRVRAMLQAGAKMGLTACRTWAFNDGAYNALQISPGQFDERVFRTVLTRKNMITGIDYRNDPTIFAWELINEPRCMTDASGDTLQDWIEEMLTFIKSVDGNHLLTVGLEGFYGCKHPKRLTVNPAEWAADLGSDFIRNSKIPAVDFASVRIYPDHWFHDKEFEDKLKYISKWTISHIEDGDNELNKPVTFTEFGLSNLNKDFEPFQRDKFNKVILDLMYKSAKRNRSGARSFFWQFLVEGIEEYNDHFGFVPWERPATYKLITEQSCRLARLQGVLPSQKKHLKKLCSRRH